MQDQEYLQVNSAQSSTYMLGLVYMELVLFIALFIARLDSVSIAASAGTRSWLLLPLESTAFQNYHQSLASYRYVGMIG